MDAVPIDKRVIKAPITVKLLIGAKKRILGMAKMTIAKAMIDRID